MSPVQASDSVGFKLMVSESMDDVVALILDRNPSATAQRELGGYYELDGVGEVVVDLAEISQALDEPMSVEDFLVYVASYYGRISVEGNTIRLSAKMLDIGDYEALAADGAALEGAAKTCP